MASNGQRDRSVIHERSRRAESEASSLQTQQSVPAARQSRETWSRQNKASDGVAVRRKVTTLLA